MLSSIQALAAHVSQRCWVVTLSYIVFLHQTTTAASVMLIVAGLSYIVFLHQTTTDNATEPCLWHCLISSFYIKPQRTTVRTFFGENCLISSFYIKPQHRIEHTETLHIVLYRLSTSNHNSLRSVLQAVWLSYIVFLHQTTTSGSQGVSRYVLSYIVFLHQTTTIEIV